MVVNATEEHIEACAKVCENITKIFNVYFYHSAMNNPDWLAEVCRRCDTILINREGAEGSVVAGKKPVVWFGVDEELSEPSDYFNK